MKKALLKDTLREIKGSLGRFISIFAIIALGCGFFSGVKSTMPDMVETAEQYFRDQSLMDLKLMSSIGVKSEDVAAVRAAENVEAASAGYSRDVFYYYNNQNSVLKVMSVPNETMASMNSVVLLEGRMPENKGECVVERKMNSPDTFVIGGKLTLSSPSESEKITDIFTTDTFEIVGIITSPLYIGYERDYTDIGNGQVLCYMMIREEDFALDYYSELYIRLSGIKSDDPFSEEYADEVSLLSRQASEAFRKSVTARRDKLVSQAEDKIAQADSRILSLESLLTMSRSDMEHTLASGTEELEKAQAAYDKLENKSSVTALLTRSKLLQAEKQLSILRELTEADAKGDSSVRERMRAELDDAKAKSEDAKEQLKAFPELKFYEQDRFSSTDYASFHGDAGKIDAIAKVFPAFFLLIVALVTLTTMTRMIDEQRTTIGTYKALGYSVGSVISKYLIYAFSAAVTGSAIGTVIGLQVFPAIIYDSYKIMYNIPELITPFRPVYMLLCMAASVACVAFAVLYASLKTLRSEPSQLMRPKPPASGRRVLLERVGFIWRRMSFLMKVTVRNLLRYKKRFFMTAAGVAGCTALIITGFGLKNSIKTVASKQFGEVYSYDAIAVLAGEDNSGSEEAENALLSMDGIKSTVLYRSASCEIKEGSVIQPGYIITPKDTAALREYVCLRDTDTDEVLTVPDEGVFITEKLSLLTGLGPGDSVSVIPNESDAVKLPIKAVVKNYAMHYIFMSPGYYNEVFGSRPHYNMAYVNFDIGADDNAVTESLLGDSRILGISLSGSSTKGF